MNYVILYLLIYIDSYSCEFIVFIIVNLMASLDEDINDKDKDDDNKQYKDIWFEPKSFSDIIIKYGASRFHLHKVNLYQHSHVFKTMMEQDPHLKELLIKQVILLI